LVSRRVDEFLRLPDCSCVDRPKWCRCPLGALQEAAGMLSATERRAFGFARYFDYRRFNRDLSI